MPNALENSNHFYPFFLIPWIEHSGKLRNDKLEKYNDQMNKKDVYLLLRNGEVSSYIVILGFSLRRLKPGDFLDVFFSNIFGPMRPKDLGT